jgi:predicted metal-binding protein
MPVDYIKPVIDKSVRRLCYKPYHNHPKGCPNYGKRETCPPKAVLLPEYFDMNKPILAVWVAFSLEQHREKMKNKHPNWSRRQLDCCLYWQGRVNKRLRRQVEYNLGRSPLFEGSNNLIATYCPEAMGVNVTETMKNAGLILE